MNTASGDGLCDRRCLYAKTHDCRCRCLGRNHGVLRLAGETGQQPELWLGHIPYIAAAFALRRCLNCGGEDLDVLGYPHDDGYYVSQYRMKLWIYGRCARCGYENSLKKLEDTRGLQLGPVATDVDDLAYYLAVVSSLSGQDFVALLGKEDFRNIVDRVAGVVLQNGVSLEVFSSYFRLRSEWAFDRYFVKTRYRRLKEKTPDIDAKIVSRAAEYLRVLPKPPLNP
jgi:hypothetical protein